MLWAGESLDSSAVFISTYFCIIIYQSSIKSKYIKKSVSVDSRLHFFLIVRHIRGGRSPPKQSVAKGGLRLEVLNMERPKRRRDKDNPYTLYKEDSKYYVDFIDSEGIKRHLQIDKELFNLFDSYELNDLKYLNVVDRHIEHSDIWDNELNRRAIFQPVGVEELAIKKYEVDKLLVALKNLPTIQRRRLFYYYFEEWTLEEIAKNEKCSCSAVHKSIHSALKHLKKILE